MPNTLHNSISKKSQRRLNKENGGSGDILPDIQDSNNHSPDAVRYALAPLIKAQSSGKMVIRI